MELLEYYIPVGIFVLIGMLVPVVSLTLAKLLRPSKPSKEKRIVYECGEIPKEQAWHRFNIQYYLFAIIFVVFDIEIVYLYPWALVFTDPALGMLPFIEMMLFIFILVIGLVYAWKKGALEWA